MKCSQTTSKGRLPPWGRPPTSGEAESNPSPRGKHPSIKTKTGGRAVTIMDSLWAPWRMDYIRAPKKVSRNTFSSKLDEGSDKDNLILYRGAYCFVCMNLYPYNNGHLLVVPYEVVDRPENLQNEVLFEIMEISTMAMKILREKMNAEGFNFGANIGSSSGAGIAEHLHFHIVPRWSGDTNFMPVVGQTKVHVQGLEDTYNDLIGLFKKIKL